MKKYLMLLALFLFPALAFAQTVEFDAIEHPSSRVINLYVTWTADGAGDATADFPQTIANLLAGRVCTNARTIPGSAADDPPRTPPDADYDITVNTPDGLSVFGSRLTDRSAIVGEIAPPYVSSVPDAVSSVFPYLFDRSLVGEIWTFTVSGAGASGQGTLVLIFR